MNKQGEQLIRSMMQIDRQQHALWFKVGRWIIGSARTKLCQSILNERHAAMSWIFYKWRQVESVCYTDQATHLPKFNDRARHFTSQSMNNSSSVNRLPREDNTSHLSSSRVNLADKARNIHENSNHFRTDAEFVFVTWPSPPPPPSQLVFRLCVNCVQLCNAGPKFSPKVTMTER